MVNMAECLDHHLLVETIASTGRSNHLQTLVRPSPLRALLRHSPAVTVLEGGGCMGSVD